MKPIMMPAIKAPVMRTAMIMGLSPCRMIVWRAPGMVHGTPWQASLGSVIEPVSR